MKLSPNKNMLFFLKKKRKQYFLIGQNRTLNLSKELMKVEYGVKENPIDTLKGRPTNIYHGKMVWVRLYFKDKTTINMTIEEETMLNVFCSIAPEYHYVENG